MCQTGIKLRSAYPSLMNLPVMFNVTSCALLHESAEREFTHGQRQQDPTLQYSVVAYVKALSRSTFADINSEDQLARIKIAKIASN